MTNIGILVEAGGNTSYAYKIKVPIGSISSNVLDLSVVSFMDTYNKAKGNADSITNSYASGVLVSQSVIEDLVVIYTITFVYTLGDLTSKTISRALGGSITITYGYAAGALVTTTQVGGD